MKRKVAACYLKKGMAYCLMGAMLLGLSIGTAGCEKSKKEPRKQKEILRSRKWKVMMDQ